MSKVFWMGILHGRWIESQGRAHHVQPFRLEPLSYRRKQWIRRGRRGYRPLKSMTEFYITFLLIAWELTLNPALHCRPRHPTVPGCILPVWMWESEKCLFYSFKLSIIILISSSRRARSGFLYFWQRVTHKRSDSGAKWLPNGIKWERNQEVGSSPPPSRLQTKLKTTLFLIFHFLFHSPTLHVESRSRKESWKQRSREWIYFHCKNFKTRLPQKCGLGHSLNPTFHLESVRNTP